jgi:hypothetical protein
MKISNLSFAGIIALLIITVLIGLGLKYAYANIEGISVSIEYNIAGIIAALSGDSGIAAAGFGYEQGKIAGRSNSKDTK